MRSLLKSLAEPVAAQIAWQTRVRSIREGLLVLAYHNVRPPGESPKGEHSLHIPWQSFVDHLDVLSAHAEFIPLSAVNRPAGRQPRLRVALTFDDAYAGAVELAVPELVRRGIPATMFVAPGLLDGKASWWDQMAEPVGGVLNDDLRVYALETLGGAQGRIQAWAGAQRVPWVDAMPDWASGASATAVIEASHLPGIDLGAHSWSHPNLRSLSQNELELELRTPMEWLKGHGAMNGTALAYPYGLANEVTIAAARATGYASAFRVSGGFLSASTIPHSLPRLNVPAALSAAGLKLRLAGRLIH